MFAILARPAGFWQSIGARAQSRPFSNSNHPSQSGDTFPNDPKGPVHLRKVGECEWHQQRAAYVPSCEHARLKSPG
jgi:hypothetical protein